MAKEITTLAAGCFWCVEAVFSELKGVEKVESGYSGGNVPNPTYEQVCNDETGHAEVVQIIFNPKIISFKEILEIFFTVHDPTTMNRQGPDVGSQYRSAIFYHDESQRKNAEKVIKDIEKKKIWRDSIVTQLVPFEKFYKAEKYHQKYYESNPNQTYCRLIIDPKVIKFRKMFADKLKK